jgi:hypothetical protein
MGEPVSLSRESVDFVDLRRERGVGRGHGLVDGHRLNDERVDIFTTGDNTKGVAIPPAQPVGTGRPWLV